MRRLKLGLGLTKGGKGGGISVSIGSGLVITGTELTATVNGLVGGETVTYQWTDDGANIAGRTSSTYTVAIGTDSVADASLIRCVATVDGTPYTSNARTVAYAAGSFGALSNQSFAEDTGNRTYVFAAATGANLTWTYSLVSPPAGVTIDSATRTVTFNTDTMAQQTGTSFTVRATDQYGRQIDQSATITIFEVADLSFEVVAGAPSFEGAGVYTLTVTEPGYLADYDSGDGAGVYTIDTTLLGSGPVNLYPGELSAASYNVGDTIELAEDIPGEPHIPFFFGEGTISISYRIERDNVEVFSGSSLSYEVTAGGDHDVYAVATDDDGSTETLIASRTVVAAPLKVIFYGQSNTDRMFNVDGAAPAALSGTRYWDGSSFVTPPGHGARALANALKTASGRDVDIAKAAAVGASSNYFVEGEDGFDVLFTDAYTGLGDVDAVVIRQGEGDADSSDPGRKAIFKANWLAAADDIEALAGKPVPMVFMSLSTYGGDQSTISDAEWWRIQEAIRELCEEDARFHLGGSAMDLARADFFHTTNAANEFAGTRLGLATSAVLGLGGTNPTWYITAAERASTTTTTVTVAHATGTDFTPTTGITGFEVSDNGSTWISATGVRTNATTITLTHSAVSGTADRYIRYQYGTVPDITGIVKDNSANTVPLQISAGVTVVDLALPVMTSSATPSVANGDTFVVTLTASRPSTYAIGGTNASLFEIVSGELRFITAPSVSEETDYSITITPTATDNSDVGSAQSMTVTVTVATQRTPERLGNTLIGNNTGTNVTSLSSSSAISAPTGNRRCAVLFVHAVVGATNSMNDVAATWGSVSFTKLNTNTSTAANDVETSVFYMLEDDIPAGAETVTVTATRMDRPYVRLVTYGDVDQTTPFGTTVEHNSNPTTGTTYAVTVNISNAASAMLSAVTVKNGGSSPGTVASVSDATEIYEGGTSFQLLGMGGESFPGVTGNDTHTWTFPNQIYNTLGVELFGAVA